MPTQMTVTTEETARTYRPISGRTTVELPPSLTRRTLRGTGPVTQMYYARRGEITPEKLIVIGEVARDFDLYTKITGGQRIDLFGARMEQLPAIWKRLVDAGFESGHAYGKSLRTVKSCVGSTWCRYGVQDSAKMAIIEFIK